MKLPLQDRQKPVEEEQVPQLSWGRQSKVATLLTGADHVPMLLGGGCFRQ
jgi:hypothetical protein